MNIPVIYSLIKGSRVFLTYRCGNSIYDDLIFKALLVLEIIYTIVFHSSLLNFIPKHSFILDKTKRSVGVIKSRLILNITQHKYSYVNDLILSE
jgi:hypothetical protein